MKRLVLTAAMTVPLALASACSSDSGGGTSQSGDVKISFVTAATADAYWQQAKCAAQATAKDVGFTLDFQGPNAFDSAAELQTLAAVTQRRPDAIVLVPTDPNSFIAPTKQAIAQGIPVVTQDGRLNDPVDAQNVRTDGAAAGAMGADQLGELMGGKGTVLVQGTLSSVPTLAARVDGFVERMKSKYPDIKVLPTQYSNGQLNKSAGDAENIVRANPDVSGVYSITSFEAGPTASGLKAAGVLGDVKWVAWDATEVEIGLLKNGDIDALVAQDPTEQTVKALTTAHQLATGEIKPSDIDEKEVFVPAQVITADNLEDPAIKALYEVTC